MKKPKPLKRPRGSDDAKLVPYPEARDRFLARLGDTDAALLESYAAVGRFVVDRWLAEELKRPDGQDLDEQACWDVWDQCTEKHLRDLRTEAQQLLQSELKKGRVSAYVADWGRRAEPVRWLMTGLSWLARETAKGFVGAIGILLFGLLIVWLAPHIAKSIRSTINDNLPAETRPTNTAEK